MKTRKKSESPPATSTVSGSLDITERKVFEQALSEAERKYRDIFDNASEGIFQTTPGGRFLIANPALANMLGFDSPDELIKSRTNISHEHYVDPETRKEFKRMLDENGFVRDFVHEAYRKDGTRIWLSENVRAVRDDNGTVRYYEGTSTDITERRLARNRSAAFANLAQKMSGARTQLNAGQIIAQTASDLVGWDALNLDLYETDSDLVYPMLNVDTIDGKQVDVTTLVSIQKPTARSRRVINHGPELIIRKEPIEFEEDAIPFGDKSRPSAALMTVPIRHASKVIGLLSVQSYRPRAYDNAGLGVLQALADHCGEALNRIRAEELLYQSEERYRDLVENSRELICTHDLEGRLLSANRAAVKIMGYELNAFSRETNCREILAPEVRDQFDSYLARIRAERVASGLMSVQTRTGEKRIWEYHCTLRTEGVTAPIVRGMARDITERKRAEAALRKAEQKYRDIFENAGEGIFQTTPDGRYVAANPALARMHGFDSPEELILSRNDISRQVYVDSGCREEFKHLLEQQGIVRAFEHEVFRKDGSRIWVSVNARAVRDDQGAILYYEGTAQDITGRKQAEDALRASESFRRTIIESEPECVKLIAPDCTLLEMNPAGLAMIGATSIEEVAGHSALELVAPECRKAFLEMHERVCQGNSMVGEFEIIGFTGERRWIETHAVPLRNAESNVIAQLAIARDITERRRSEESLKLFRSLLDRSSDAVEVIDPKTLRFLDCNESAYQCLGYSREEFLSLTVFDIDPNLNEALISRLDEEIERAGFAILESVHRRKDGSTFPVEVNVKIVRLERDYRLAVVRDITERKRAEDDLRRQNEILEKIVEHIPAMINFTGSDGRIKLVNREWQRTLGWSLEEVLQEDIDVFAECYPDSAYREEVLNFLAEANGNWVDFKTRIRDGRVIDTCWARVKLSDGTTIGIGQDITARKQSEGALRDAEQKYRELFENARDAMYVHDLNGTYTSVNRAAEKLSGYTREEILGKNFAEFIAPNYLKDVRDNVWKKMQQAGETSYEIEVIAKDGRRVPVELSSRLIYEHGVPVGVQGTAGDITERKQSQEALQNFSRRLLEAQETERQRIARTLHDEIGQVLTAVKINLQTMNGTSTSTEVDDRVRESLNVVDEALVRVRDLSIDLRPPHLDDFGLGTALRWYIDSYSQRTGTVAKLSGDREQIGRRLPREIETACFRIAQEALTNIARHAAASSVSVKLKQLREQLRLTITDNGVGFDVSAVTNGATAETLGLRGMKERAQAVGGSVKIYSTIGQGTQVRALFPILRVQE